jgi:DNA polymerase I-like protein with 3'-5' exonuclease and polymerase domains
MILEGTLSAPILFVSDFQRPDCAAEARAMSEGMKAPLLAAIRSAGLLNEQIAFTVIHPRMPRDGKTMRLIAEQDLREDIQRFRAFLSTHSANVIVPLGEYAMQIVTGLEGIAKWHCNVVKAKAEFEGRKVIPLLHPEHVIKQYGDSAYLSFGCMRVREESAFPHIRVADRTFKLGPSFEETMTYLYDVVAKAEVLGVDIETGSGQINTVGFAVSPLEAIAIKTLPEFYTPEQHYKIWGAIGAILEGPQPKVLQNFIYESTWFARYGFHMRQVVHDTMWAMKFLHPEFEKGLDNVGRIYTTYPYWKDDNDDWSQVRDWARHLDYNCKDTTGTLAAYYSQRDALKTRGMGRLFDDYIMRFAPVIHEMCVRGLRLDPQALVLLKEKLGREKESQERILKAEFDARLKREVNPRSPKQLKSALKELGLKIPVQKGKESTDKKALVKLRKKHPDEPVLPALIGLSATNKQLSSYVDFEYDRQTGRVHYSLDGCGTETGRWAGYNSGWGEGFNPQTVPKTVRNCFVADEGKLLIQVDLAQAESRYVAWEAPEPTLMQMLNEGRDVHKYVAGKIFKKPEEIVSKLERQLGKKSGHSANYSVGPRTFSESCLVEMNHYITENEARRIIEMYFETFPGIRRRQENIRREVYAKRVLRTPIGRERHFYGRMNDATFREAYAYSPQSVIPDITNHLMLKLWELKDCLDVEFLLQVHDSLLLQAPPERVQEIAELCKDLKAWHPKITLAGGELLIPVEVEVGTRWGKMENV